jgi:glycosyl transferase family 25
MKAFVINLERSAARRASMRQQLNAQGIEFEFIKAVDGATLTDEYLNQVCDYEELNKRQHLMHKGMYGCILSHYHIYQRIVADNLPYALVMEDDIIIEPGLKAILAEIEPKIRTNEAILLFSQNNQLLTVFSNQDTEQLSGPYKIAYPMMPWAFGSTAAYIISLEAARGMMNWVLPLRDAPDAWNSFYRDKAIHSLRCVTPFLMKPAGFTSDIDYVANNSIMGKTLGFIKKHKIPVLNQLLDYRRKLVLEKAVQYTFTPERSPVAEAQEVAS